MKKGQWVVVIQYGRVRLICQNNNNIPVILDSGYVVACVSGPDILVERGYH